jgi:5,10-methylenetetrahydrofolate reductase
VGKLNAETNTAETPDYRTTDIIVLHLSCRYITKEELEQALKEQGLYDAEKIKEVISDADSDNVRNKYCVNLVGIINNRNYSIINVTKNRLLVIKLLKFYKI